MDDERDRKRKKDKNRDDDEDRKENRSKRPRSKSRSPARRADKESRRKRRHSKSPNPDIQDKSGKKDAEIKKEAPEKKNKETDMLNTRTGGAYIPPARLRMMQAQITDKASVAYQRLAWEALKKSIHGHINKINVGNIGIIIKELLRENIVRGRGLLCRSIIQAQAASPTFTNVYAALVAAVNSRFPNIGELLLKRLVIQFKRGFKRNDKPICISAASFVAHLVNQRVAHEILALELLTLLVETPTDDSVEVAIAFLKECGQKLTEVSSKGVNAIFEMLRNILHEGQLDKRVQYMIEVMFQVWKDGFKDHPALIEELELVPEEDQFTHLLMLDDATDAQDILNVFKFDDKYEENEQKYKDLSKEILGSDAESGEEGSGSESGSEEEDEEEDQESKPVTIIDNTETNLIALRRTIYLTINSSLDFEECAHKLMKMQLKPGQEVELCHMFLDCCAEQRTYEKFYGLLAQRFCNINRMYIGPFEEIFKDSYGTAHRLDTNRLRNVSKFFAHLLFTDSISWEVLECVKLNEEDTTSSSRIYIKILFQELAEYMGLKKLNDRLTDPTLQGAFSGVFPRDNPKNTRFSINFFTSIGLGGLTDALREHLKQMPKNLPPAITEIKVDSESSSDSSSSSSSDSSSSDSDQEKDKESKSKKSKSKDKSKSKNKKDDSPKPRTPAGDNNVNILNQAKERWGHDGFYDTYGKDAKRHEKRREIDDDNFVKPYPRDGRNDRRREENNGDERRRHEDRDDDRRDSRRKEDGGRRRNEEDRDRSRDDRGKASEDDGYDSRSRRERDGKRNDKEPRNERSDERDTRRDRDARNDGADDGRNRRNDREDRYEMDRNDRNYRPDDRDNRRNDRPDERDSRRNDRPDDRYARRNDRSDDKDSRKNDREERYDKEDRRHQDNLPDEKDARKSRRQDDEGYESKSKGKNKDKTEDRTRKASSEESDSGSESDSKREKEKRRSKKEKRKEKKRKESSEDESDSEDEQRKREKSKKDKRKQKKTDTEESSDSEPERKKKKSKKDKSRRHDGDDWDIGNKYDAERAMRPSHRQKTEEMPNEWDIHRESSIKREVSGRYWDAEDVSKERKERKRQG